MAISWRRQAEAHKRLILLGTISLITAAVARFINLIEPQTSPLALFIGTDVFVAILIVYDMFSRGRLHWATWTGGTMQYLDYESGAGGWEDGMILKQSWTVAVTPSVIEPIAGHFQFATL